MRGLQQLAGRRQLAIVAITHLRKAPANDPFDEINATTGLLASVDNALIMRQNAGVVELHRRGREYEDDAVLALKGDANTLLWTVAGNAEEVQRSKERAAVLEALSGSKDPLSPKDIADITEMKPGNVRRLLPKMVESGEVKRVGRGLYTIPGNIGNIGNNDAPAQAIPGVAKVTGARALGNIGNNASLKVTGVTITGKDGNDRKPRTGQGRNAKDTDVTGVTEVSNVSDVNACRSPCSPIVFASLAGPPGQGAVSVTRIDLRPSPESPTSEHEYAKLRNAKGVPLCIHCEQPKGMGLHEQGTAARRESGASSREVTQNNGLGDTQRPGALLHA